MLAMCFSDRENGAIIDWWPGLTSVHLSVHLPLNRGYLREHPLFGIFCVSNNTTSLFPTNTFVAFDCVV